MKMKSKIFLWALAAGLMASCQKDLDVIIADPVTGPDNTWFNILDSNMAVARLQNDLRPGSQNELVSFTPAAVSIQTLSGLQCNFPQGAFVTASGLPVTGNVRVESLLLKKKGDLVRMGIPTTSNGSLLVSGGAFYLRLMKDGQELQLAPSKTVSIRFNDAPTNPAMQVFFGAPGNTGMFNWLPSMDSVNRVYALSQAYEVISNRLRWINCDYFYDSAGTAQTTVTPVLPSNYTNANTVAYIVFHDMRSVVGLTGNATTRKFISGRLPVNKQVTLIILSKQGNDYFMGHQQLTTAVSPSVTGPQQVTITPVISTLANINAYLDTL